MSRKKKRQKEDDRREIMRNRTVLTDGTIVLGGRYVMQPNGTLRDCKYIIEKERNHGRKKESSSTEGTEVEEAQDAGVQVEADQRDSQ